MNDEAGRSPGQLALPDNSCNCSILDKWDIPHIGEKIKVEEEIPVNLNAALGFNLRIRIHRWFRKLR